LSAEGSGQEILHGLVIAASTATGRAAPFGVKSVLMVESGIDIHY